MKSKLSAGKNKSLSRDFCIYRYLDRESGKVLYIGKTDASLKARILAHEKEDKFQPYRGLWQISYFRLSNSVETDIVEKYLINRLKPLLNEKDLEEGLSLGQMDLPKWRPIEEYLENPLEREERARLKKMAASADLELYLDALDGLQAGGVFSSRRLHPTGRLSDGKTKVQITSPIVKQKDGLYLQELTEEGKRFLMEKPKQIECAIYREVWEGIYPASFQILWDFADRLEEFRENGYLEEEGAEPFTLQIRDHAKEILSVFGPMFAASCPCSSKDAAFVELSEEGFRHFEECKETIAGKELHFYKSQEILLDIEPEKETPSVKELLDQPDRET